MKIIALVFAASTCLIAVPAFAGSPADVNTSMTVAQVDVHIGDRDHDRDRHHCHTTTIREKHDGRIVVRKERHCD
jgi:hypothetical protein